MEFIIQRNDIANVETDVVVLPANWRLRIGPGASAALFEAAGRDELEVECAMRFEQAKDKGVRLVPGVSVPTLAYALPAKAIMHTIVPRWRPKEPDLCYEELCKSYASALVTTDEMGFESIAFPLLAAGNNGFDIDVAIDIAIQSLTQFQPRNKLSKAYLVVFGWDATQRVRNRGYEVGEAIDQIHVLNQDVRQASWWKEEKERRNKEKEEDKPLVQAMIDDGIKWIQSPDNQAAVIGLAIAVAKIVLPEDGSAAKAFKVIDAALPFLPFNR